MSSTPAAPAALLRRGYGCSRECGSIGAGGYVVYGSGVAGSGYNPCQIEQGAVSQSQGTVTVEFKDAPPGRRVIDTRSLGIDVNHDVGYTRIGKTGMGG